MKKAAIFLLAVCAFITSCQKTVKVPLEYTVETAQNKPLEDIYVPDKGSYTLSLLVKYLGGYHEDKVTISIAGLPKDVTVVEDTFSKVPTYMANFVLNTAFAARATYPLTITTTAPGSKAKTYHINMKVIAADCASGLWGNYSGANTCTARDYTYTATAATTGTANELNITNLGGYGPATSTHVLINCAKDSLSIPQQNIGNGTNLSGSGVISGNKMIITYTATTTPGGFPETCIATLTRQ